MVRPGVNSTGQSSLQGQGYTNPGSVDPQQPGDNRSKQGTQDIHQLIQDANLIRNSPREAVATLGADRVREVEARAPGLLNPVNEPTRLQQASMQARGYSTYRTPQQEAEHVIVAQQYPTGPAQRVTMLSPEARDAAIARGERTQALQKNQYPEAKWLNVNGQRYTGEAAASKYEQLASQGRLNEIQTAPPSTPRLKEKVWNPNMGKEVSINPYTQTRTTSGTNSTPSSQPMQKMGLDVPILTPAIEKVGKTIWEDVNLFAEKIIPSPITYESDKVQQRYGISREEYEQLTSSNIPLIGGVVSTVKRMALSEKSSAFGAAPSVETMEYLKNVQDIGDIQSEAARTNYDNLVNAVAKARESGSSVTVSGKTYAGKDLEVLLGESRKDYERNQEIIEANKLIGVESYQAQEIGFNKLGGIFPIPKNIRTAEVIAGGAIVGVEALGAGALIAPTQLGGAGLTTRAGLAISAAKGLTILPTIRYASTFVDTAIENTPKEVFTALTVTSPLGAGAYVMSKSKLPIAGEVGDKLLSGMTTMTTEGARYVGYYYGIKAGSSIINKGLNAALPTTVKITPISMSRVTTGGVDSDISKLTYEFKNYNVERKTRFLGTQVSQVSDVTLIKNQRLLTKSVLNPSTANEGFYSQTVKSKGYEFNEAGKFSTKQTVRNLGLDVNSEVTKIPTSRYYRISQGESMPMQQGTPLTSYQNIKSRPQSGTTVESSYKTKLYGPSVMKFTPPREAMTDYTTVFKGEGKPLGGVIAQPYESTQTVKTYKPFATSGGGGGGGFTGKGLKSAYEQGMDRKIAEQNRLRNMFSVEANAEGYDYAYYTGELPSVQSEYIRPISSPVNNMRSANVRMTMPLGRAASTAQSIRTSNPTVLGDAIKYATTQQPVSKFESFFSSLNRNQHESGLKNSLVSGNNNRYNQRYDNILKNDIGDKLEEGNLFRNPNDNRFRNRYENFNNYRNEYTATEPFKSDMFKWPLVPLPPGGGMIGGGGGGSSRGRGYSRQKRIKLGINAAKVVGSILGIRKPRRRKR